jgi:hypothetical protein
MNNKTGDKGMQTEAVTENITDMSAVLSLKQVHNYTDQLVERGHAEYNNQRILVRSKHPLDQCLRRGIIEDAHYDTGKAFVTLRDCAFSRTHGRIYNDTGEGDGSVDAATLYTNTWRKLTKKQWALISLVCFAQQKPTGDYFSEADYAYLYGIGPNIQSAFEALGKAIVDSRKEIKARIEDAERNNLDGHG